PAVAFDLLRPRLAGFRLWQQGLAMGVVFVAALLAVQWPFADFLLSPGARNAFFVADRWDYSNHLCPWRCGWWSLDRDARCRWNGLGLLSGIGFALGIAALSSWWGIARGAWMRGVQR